MIGWFKKGLSSLKTAGQNSGMRLNGNSIPIRGFSSLSYRLRETPLVYYLIGANVSIYALYETNLMNHVTFQRHFMLSRENIQKHRYHTVLTHSFAHQSFIHLATNMMGLYFFGNTIEHVFGRRALGKMYLGGALFGAAMILLEEHKLRYQGLNRAHLGASSSVYAILTNFAMHFPRNIIYLYFIPVPAWLAGVGLMLYSTYSFGQMGGSTSHSGHLGGILFGVTAFALARKGMF